VDALAVWSGSRYAGMQVRFLSPSNLSEVDHTSASASFCHLSIDASAGQVEKPRNCGTSSRVGVSGAISSSLGMIHTLLRV
jgi:hypothetical protein